MSSGAASCRMGSYKGSGTSPQRLPSCNSHKADLEDDISAITLQPDSWGRYGHDDISAIEDALRKAKDSRSRRTRKAVKDSSEEIKIQGTLGPGITLSFQYTSPPQVDDNRAFELARLRHSIRLSSHSTLTHRAIRHRLDLWNSAVFSAGFGQSAVFGAKSHYGRNALCRSPLFQRGDTRFACVITCGPNRLARRQRQFSGRGAAPVYIEDRQFFPQCGDQGRHPAAHARMKIH